MLRHEPNANGFAPRVFDCESGSDVRVRLQTRFLENRHRFCREFNLCCKQKCTSPTKQRWDVVWTCTITANNAKVLYSTPLCILSFEFEGTSSDMMLCVGWMPQIFSFRVWEGLESRLLKMLCWEVWSPASYTTVKMLPWLIYHHR